MIIVTTLCTNPDIMMENNPKKLAVVENFIFADGSDYKTMSLEFGAVLYCNIDVGSRRASYLASEE